VKCDVDKNLVQITNIRSKLRIWIALANNQKTFARAPADPS